MIIVSMIMMMLMLIVIYGERSRPAVIFSCLHDEMICEWETDGCGRWYCREGR